MAKIKFKRGLSTKLSQQQFEDGKLIYTPDDNNLYVDIIYTDVQGHSQQERLNINEVHSSDISGLAPKESPILTGVPKAPTASSGTATTQIATTAFVQNTLSGKQDTLTAGAGINITNNVISCTAGGDSRLDIYTVDDVNFIIDTIVYDLLVQEKPSSLRVRQLDGVLQLIYCEKGYTWMLDNDVTTIDTSTHTLIIE